MTKFTALETLDLSFNQISEPLPAFFGKNMRSMRFMDFSYNNIQGLFPPRTYIDDMYKMRIFSIAHNPGVMGQFPYETITDVWVENIYISILNTTMYGTTAGLCIDVPFCRRFMYNTHADQTWVDSMPSKIEETVRLAMSGGTSTTSTSTTTLLQSF